MGFARKTIRKSRGPKTCDFCRHTIDHGERYYNIAYVWDYGFEARYTHLFCEELCVSYMDEHDEGLPDFEDSLCEWLKQQLGDEEGQIAYRASKALRFYKTK